MAALPRPTLNRIPGGDISLPRSKEKHTKDLTTLTRVELLEIKEREGKLLANKSKLSRLPDKGKRIQDFYDKVIAELDRRSNVDEAAAMFSELNIATKAKDALNELEWTGKINTDHQIDPINDVIDSDDESQMDPLRIIAKGSMHERSVKVLPPEPKLITAEDLAEIASFKSISTDSGIETLKDANGQHLADSESTDSASETSIVGAELVAFDVKEKLYNIKSKLNIFSTTKSDIDLEGKDLEQLGVDQHVRYLVEKTESQAQPVQREKFKPYKTTISDVHAVEKEWKRKKGKNWEVTAATPPPIQHNSTQLLNLMDSVQIQANYLAKLKELQEKQAAERLAAKMERLSHRTLDLPSNDIIKTNPAFTKYRTPTAIPTEQIEGIQRFNEDDEIHDTLDDERTGGGVTYTVYD